MKKIALVTGANRGIGLETSRQLAAQGYHVVMGSRDLERGRKAARDLAARGLPDVEAVQPDVSDESSIDEALASVFRAHGRIDVLVNNAGVYLDEGFDSTFETSREVLEETFETNVLGPFQLCQRVIPGMIDRGYGRVVNLSSGMGQLSEMNGGAPAYRISKTAINAVTRIFSEEAKGSDVLVNSVCPGWVKTDMGGESAELSVEEGADTVVWLATLPEDGPTGAFFRERKRIDW